MATLSDIMAYLLREHSRLRNDAPSTARLTKMVYLADWKSAIQLGNQMTKINWFFDNYGPFVWDVQDTAKSRPDLFSIEESATVYGTPKRVFRLSNKSFSPLLSVEEIAILDHVLMQTYSLDWQDFINLVYSTYPVLSSERFTFIDLVKKAKAYVAST